MALIMFLLLHHVEGVCAPKRPSKRAAIRGAVLQSLIQSAKQRDADEAVERAVRRRDEKRQLAADRRMASRAARPALSRHVPEPVELIITHVEEAQWNRD